MRLIFRWIQLTVLFVATVNNLTAQLPGMYTDKKFLFSATGDTVILKGFNAMIVYWDIHGDVNFPEIEKTGANCVRIFWKLDAPSPLPSDLDKVLENCIAHHMIPIICLWEATGDWNKIQFCVDYWCSPSIVPILKKYERHLIVNIANEPGDKSMGEQMFRDTYRQAVQQIRDAGIHTPLIIDADNWGRNADAVLDNGEFLLQEDPDHNLIFSWHLWDPQNWGTGTKSEIDRIILKAAGKDICFIVGEFGPCEQCGNCSGTRINWEYLIEKAYKNNIGYLPWVWKWTDCHSIINNSTGKYGSWVNPPWGESVAITSPYSIKHTSKRPSELYTSAGETFIPQNIVTVKPNPFAQETHFEVLIQIPSEVRITIINIHGREIASLKEKRTTPGEVLLRWNPSITGIPDKQVLFLYIIEIRNSSGVNYRSGKIIRI